MSLIEVLQLLNLKKLSPGFVVSLAMFFSTLLLQMTKDDPRPLWLTFYSPLVEKSDHGRALPAKRTQVLRYRGREGNLIMCEIAFYKRSCLTTMKKFLAFYV